LKTHIDIEKLIINIAGVSIMVWHIKRKPYWPLFLWQKC